MTEHDPLPYLEREWEASKVPAAVRAALRFCVASPDVRDIACGWQGFTPAPSVVVWFEVEPSPEIGMALHLSGFLPTLDGTRWELSL
jgi:hypothetical protein